MTWASLKLNGKMPRSIERFAGVVIITVKTEEQDLIRDVGITSMAEDFDEDQRIFFALRCGRLVEMPVKGRSACRGVGGQMEILEALLCTLFLSRRN